jgi:Terpene cyclase DEP1
MKNSYLLLAVIGYAATLPLMLIESAETSNWLLLAKPMLTWNGLFANRISTIFALDLLPAVLTFLVWVTVECKRHSMRHVWAWWLGTLLFGLGGALPLFLYFRERKSTQLLN